MIVSADSSLIAPFLLNPRSRGNTSLQPTAVLIPEQRTSYLQGAKAPFPSSSSAPLGPLTKPRQGKSAGSCGRFCKWSPGWAEKGWRVLSKTTDDSPDWETFTASHQVGRITLIRIP